nr:MAG TPA: hypothetical protein [Caudoviricetes sp.]DAQ20469.1 MAG TPA: hypothetical protein [Caudoviricetes sp.]
MAKEKSRASGEFGEPFSAELAPEDYAAYAARVPFDYQSQGYTDEYYDRRKREERLYNMMRERMKYE